MSLVSSASRQISTLIGGQDWSDYITDFPPIRDGIEANGVLSVTSTIEIAYNEGNPSGLDPLLNAALWKRSQSVRMQVRDSSGNLINHPFGYLFILRVPTLSPDGNRLTVEVGDYLALANRREVPGDASGITLGTPEDFSVICQRYLEAAGIPSSNIALGGPWGDSRALPVPKDNVNALEMAGRIAYASDFRVLYQDSTGIVRAQLVTVTSGTPSLSFNASQIPAEWFERSFEPGTAPELVKVTGTAETVATVSTPITDTPINTADREVFTSSSYELTQAFVGINNGTLLGRRAVDENRHAQRVEQRRESQPGEVVFKTGGTATKVVTSDKTEFYYYQTLPANADGVFPYRQFEKWTTIERARGISDGDDSAAPETYRIIAEGWSHDANGEVDEYDRSVFARQKEYEPDSGLGSNWRQIEDFQETWTPEGLGYRHDYVTRVANITRDRSANAVNAANKWQLTVVDSDSKPARSQGDNAPPAPELWEGPYTIDEQNYEGQATYTPPGGASLIPPERVIELPEGLGISNAVCSSIAAKWAQIYGGKEYKMLLTFPVTDALLAIDLPLWQVAYTVDGRVRTYLVDSQTYNHTADELTCAAVGILIDDQAV